jgi:hypothetical protein
LIESTVNWSERRHWFAHGFMIFNHTKAACIYLNFDGTRNAMASLSFANGLRPSTTLKMQRLRSIATAKPSLTAPENLFRA